MKFDLHGFELADAQVELEQVVAECVALGDATLEIVHGYHGGQVLLHYVRSHAFLNDTAKAGFNLRRIRESETPGSTTFQVSSLG